MFPATSIFNTRIDDPQRFPVHPNSAAWISAVGANTAFHPDWGTEENQQNTAGYYGIPYNVVDNNKTAWPTVSFDIIDPRGGNGAGVPDESDCAVPNGAGGYNIRRDCTTLAASERRFPFPYDNIIKAEHGACNDPTNPQCGGDRHILMVEQGACRLWESYYTYKPANQWLAYSTAAWDLKSNTMRPDTWTSGDAAGLPILPLLIRYDEATAGQINHALRFTLNGSNGYVWPASHRAGSNTARPPFGVVMRLKSSFVIPANWTTQAKAIARAMQQYGLYFADNGSNFFVQGEPNAQWNSATFSQLRSITMNNMEYVNISAITGDSRFKRDSYQARWP
jgi:hypothetical protein